MSAALLTAAPVVLVTILAAWAFWDFLGIPETILARSFIALLLVGLGALAIGFRFASGALRRLGFALVVVSYVGAHLFVLPLDPAAALAFVTLVLVAVEVRILAERFAPIFAAELDLEDRDRLQEALAHALMRIVVASAIAFLGSYLTADLALSGALPLRTIPTALLLSMGLILVVLLLAFWTSVERRMGGNAGARTPIQTPK